MVDLVDLVDIVDFLAAVDFVVFVVLAAALAVFTTLELLEDDLPRAAAARLPLDFLECEDPLEEEYLDREEMGRRAAWATFLLPPPDALSAPASITESSTKA